MKYQLIIFDWDGTLADSTGRIVDSMRRAGQELGLPDVPDADIQNIIGLGLPEAIKTDPSACGWKPVSMLIDRGSSARRPSGRVKSVMWKS